jgi:MFS family permease
MTTTEAPTRRRSLAAAWRSGPYGVPGFRLLTAGQFASTIGDYCYAVALPWLVLSDGHRGGGGRRPVVGGAANLAITGTTEVALPALAHARFGAVGYGAVLACFAVTSIAGALLVARVGDRYRPALLIAGPFLAAAAGIAAAPFLGGLPGVAAGMAVFGLAIGVDQVVSVTLIQRCLRRLDLGRARALRARRSAHRDGQLRLRVGGKSPLRGGLGSAARGRAHASVGRHDDHS